MTSSVTFSLGIIQEIFGHEFASEWKSRQDPDGGGSSSDSGQTVEFPIDGIGRTKSGKAAASKKNIESFFKEQQHVEDNVDGQKPTKSPRSASVPPTQQLSVDVGDPIRNYIRKKAGLPITRHYAPAPPPSDTLGEIMNEKLQGTPTGTTDSRSHSQEGRLGPKIAKFDVAAHFGSFVMTADRLGLTSQCNFGSVRANVCLFKGKWQFEVQLGSKGVMQIGFALLTTKFSQEKGVGDTVDSFGYDGNRMRKWNGTTAPYGEHWQTGDIIGCLIDLDTGTIEYQRNGKSLGLAFSKIPRGRGIAYFPTVSLAWGESVVANFGASPLQFPVNGYFPIQAEIPIEDTKVPLLFGWLENTLRIFPTPDDPARGLRLSREDYETLVIVANRIFQFLAPSMNSAFIIEQTFLPFYARAVGLPEKVAIQDEVILPAPISHVKVHLLLDLMWTFLEEAEMKKCIERMCIVFMNCFRSNSLSLSYPFQIYSLRCLIALSSHRKTRRYLIHHILFDQIKLMHFLHIRPVDDEVLKVLMPVGYWKGKLGADEAQALEYKGACDLLKKHIQAVEEVQMQFLRTLLTNTDGSETRPSSRSVFLRKFRAYIRDSIRPGSLLQHPLNRALCAFFRVLKITMLLWREEVEPNDEFALPDLPTSIFFDLTIDYQDSDRLGGMANYLYKTYHEQVSAALNVPDYIPGSTNGTQSTPMTSFFGFPEFAGLALAVDSGSASSPSVTTAGGMDEEDGASHSGTTTTSAGNELDEDTVRISRTGAVRGTLSVGVSTSRSESGATGSIGFGIHTPTLGVLHPPSPTFPTVSHTENVPHNHPLASVTSSAEDVVVVPRMTALIAGTQSGTNLMIPVYDFPRDTGIRLLPGGILGFSSFERTGVRPHNPATALVSRDSGIMDSRTSLRELLDDTIMIFSCGVKKHVEKIVTLRRNTEEYIKALEEAQEALSRPGLNEEETIELTKSVEIFSRKLDEQQRHMGWVLSGVFTVERQRLAFELLKVVLKTLTAASSQGVLFSFVPEFYVTTMVHLTGLLVTQFHPTVLYTDLPGIDEVLSQVAEFVSTHFIDSRISTAETKDTLTQALGAFICDKKMLSSLEQMPPASMKRMVKYLLRPYENRAWAQSNSMLLRIWQGSGFAFRYSNTSQARKAFRSGLQQEEFIVSSNLPPNPSVVFQNIIATVLLENPKLASNYVHSVLNQLNWAFSEFVGLLQEIHTAASRNERALMESRQLKVCSTTHELTQSLLRVLEMIIQKCPQVLTDFKRESAEILLDRLSVLLSQVLNRIGAASGIFAQVIELGISGIENISYFPILSSVAGIILALVERELSLERELDEMDLSQLIGTRAILQEPSFQVSSLDFFLGRNIPDNTPLVLQFSLRNYIPEDITEVEVKRFENVMKHIADWEPRLETNKDSISDDDICTICYAYAKSTTFKPCNHRSCRSCILHHLMNRGECFFCKGLIQQVVDDSGIIIHDVHAVSPDSDSETTIGSTVDQLI